MNSPSMGYDMCATAPRQSDGVEAVGAERLSDSARESAIWRAGDALQKHMGEKEAARRRYIESSCLTDKADMDAADLKAREALRLMETLIRGRSPAQVKRLEQERGIA